MANLYYLYQCPRKLTPYADTLLHLLQEILILTNLSAKTDEKSSFDYSVDSCFEDSCLRCLNEFNFVKKREFYNYFSALKICSMDSKSI